MSNKLSERYFSHPTISMWDIGVHESYDYSLPASSPQLRQMMLNDTDYLRRCLFEGWKLDKVSGREVACCVTTLLWHVHSVIKHDERLREQFCNDPFVLAFLTKTEAFFTE